MKNRGSSNTTRKESEKGLSAVELVIAMAVFLVVMSSVYGILKIGNMSRTTVNSRTENVKNVRMALNTIGREAVNAGLGYNRIGGTVPDDFTTNNFGLPADPDKDPDLLTAISEGVNISESDLSKNGEKNDVVAFAFRDFQFNDGFPIVINDVTQNGNTLILKTPDGACANCRPYDLFLIETGEGRQAVILSTDIVNNNQIVLGGDNDPMKINYGPVTGSSGSNSGSNSGSCNNGNGKGNGNGCNNGNGGNNSGSNGGGGNKLCLPLDLLCFQLGGNSGSNSGSGSNGNNGNSGSSGNPGSSTNNSGSVDKSAVKKCTTTVTTNCIDYGQTSIVAKKIYLVSYSVAADGTLIRTTFGNNTGADADNQIVRHPIANGVRSLKIHYLLEDGTTVDDPAVANTQKEKCNDIVQIEVALTVESDTNQMGVNNSNLITLTSTFSTRNLKYDVY